MANDNPVASPALTSASAGASLEEPAGASLVGKRVLAYGLLSAKVVNGRRGVVLSFDPATGRCLVRLTHGEARKVKLKPTNMMKDLTGKRVVAHGLSREDVNGRHGVVLSYDQAAGRYAVQLEPDAAKYKLKPANILEDATEPLRRAAKSYPYHALQGAIASAVAPEMIVDPQVLQDARARLVALRTEKMVAVMNRRQLEPLVAAVAELELEAGEGGVVEETVMEEVRALVAVLEAEPPGAELAPTGTHGTDALLRPAHPPCGLRVPPPARRG